VTHIVALDTETTSLRHDRRAWEIALIIRKPGVPDEETSWFIRRADLDLGNADPQSLKYGRFFQRHPEADGSRHAGNGHEHEPVGEYEALAEIEHLTAGAHILGCVPNFDTELIAARMRAHGLCPSWHHHLIDVEPLMVGALHARGEKVELPWKSDDLAARLGVDPAGEGRHTALGDAAWSLRIWHAVTGER
jgi:hypothetical protein